MRLQLALDAVGVLADEDERARMPKDERRERRVGRVLAATAEDENDPSRLVRERLDGFDRRINVRLHGSEKRIRWFAKKRAPGSSYERTGCIVGGTACGGADEAEARHLE